MGRTGKAVKLMQQTESNTEKDLPVKKRISSGFPTLDGYTSDAEPEPTEIKIGKKKKSGGFQSMGLSYNVFGGVLKKGYKVPTPIQRKCIPIIMEGRDVVGMARTGSGKTAAFLIPMLEHLLKTSSQLGCRALILSPTRELAIQTLKFTKQLGKCCSLKAELILGGDSLNDQFAALHTYPDIVIATPGRLLHVLVEMEMKLKHVEYLVFDEADRLFEMGFAEQLLEILRRVPDSRQTLLFSATLPKSLVEFARAGLRDPMLIRLDVENKISEDLKMAYFYTRSSNKVAILLHLLKDVIDPKELTVVFAATRHHVEYLREILEAVDISCTYIFSALDSSARKINIAKFASKKTNNVLLVTDIAARGIDIPMLDNVINYNFPGKPKLFIHRVGRVARAGRTGTAYSIIGPDEIAYLMDLHLFIGRPLKLAKIQMGNDDHGVFGKVPDRILEKSEELFRYHHDHSVDIASLKKVTSNALKQYIKSRPLPSRASIKRVKEMDVTNLLDHPMFEKTTDSLEKTSLVEEIRNYKPSKTIFEISTRNQDRGFSVMRKKRDKHNATIQMSRKSAAEKKQKAEILPLISEVEASAESIDETFSRVISPGQKPGGFTFDKRGKQLPNVSSRDEEFYIPHVASDQKTEHGLGVNSFVQQVAEDVLDLTHDDKSRIDTMQRRVKWDRKRKRFVDEGGKEQPKKIKTESGAYIPATYKKYYYRDWLTQSKEDGMVDNENFGVEVEEEPEDSERKGIRSSGLQSRYRHKQVKGDGKVKNELLSSDQMLKSRKRKEMMQARNQKKDKKKPKKGGRDKWGGRTDKISTGGGGKFGKTAQSGRKGGKRVKR